MKPLAIIAPLVLVMGAPATGSAQTPAATELMPGKTAAFLSIDFGAINKGLPGAKKSLSKTLLSWLPKSEQSALQGEMRRRVPESVEQSLAELQIAIGVVRLPLNLTSLPDGFGDWIGWLPAVAVLSCPGVSGVDLQSILMKMGANADVTFKKKTIEGFSCVHVPVGRFAMCNHGDHVIVAHPAQLEDVRRIVDGKDQSLAGEERTMAALRSVGPAQAVLWFKFLDAYTDLLGGVGDLEEPRLTGLKELIGTDSIQDFTLAARVGDDRFSWRARIGLAKKAEGFVGQLRETFGGGTELTPPALAGAYPVRVDFRLRNVDALWKKFLGIVQFINGPEASPPPIPMLGVPVERVIAALSGAAAVGVEENEDTVLLLGLKDAQGLREAFDAAKKSGGVNARRVGGYDLLWSSKGPGLVLGLGKDVLAIGTFSKRGKLASKARRVFKLAGRPLVARVTDGPSQPGLSASFDSLDGQEVVGKWRVDSVVHSADGALAATNEIRGLGKMLAKAQAEFARQQIRRKAREAHSNLRRLRSKQSSFKAEFGQYAPVRATGAKEGKWNARPCSKTCSGKNPKACNEFTCIGFDPGGSVNYTYACNTRAAKGKRPAEFTCAAFADLDGNGRGKMFVYGTSNATGTKKLVVRVPRIGPRGRCKVGKTAANEVVDCNPKEL